MRARRLRISIVAMVAVVSLGACGDGSGSSNEPAPPSSVVTTAAPGESRLTAEMLEQLCSPENTAAPDTPVEDDANPYAAAVKGVARAIGEQCAKRENP